MSLSRRGFLGLGATAAAEVAALGPGGWAIYKMHRPASPEIDQTLALSGPKPAVPTRGHVVTGSFSSSHMRNGLVDFAICYPYWPRLNDNLPVVLALYGRGDTYQTALSPDEVGLQKAQAAVVASGIPAFAIVTVEAGPTAYWHDRADGRSVQTMIRTELLPALARRGLHTDRIGLLGWSMGGYGALLLAEKLGSAGVAAVAAFAPALFDSYRHASPVAFDSAADFAANDVSAGVAKLSGIPIRIVCGKRDPFYSQVRRFGALPHQPQVVTSFGEGGHGFGYWRTQTAEQLQFIASRLPME
jgi:S-formylglutathione hydrolase FrmB